MSPPPNPHDERLRECWKICRYGAERIREEAARRAVLDWIARMEPRFPGSPHLGAWRRIAGGEDAGALAELRSRRDFFELPEERRSFWRPLIQSQPFACVFPGRTTRERRAVLSRLP